MSTTSDVRPKFYRLDDAAAVYGLTRRQLKRWISEGRLPRYKPSGVTGPVYVLAEDLDALMRKALVPAGKPAGRQPASKKSA